MTTVYVAIGATLFALVVLTVLFKSFWRVAEPNEALIISGFRNHDESLGFRIVTGKGTLVWPFLETVRRMSLDLREAELEIDCVTHQGIPLKLRGVVIYKVGDDVHSIANAARRFLDQQQDMNARVHNVFAGHLRAIVGNMTVEEMIRDREKLTQLTRESSGVEMEKLGLIVDSLQIQEIGDPTGYIKNLGRPHAASVESLARIAQAEADESATQREQEAEARKAEARRTSQVKQAGYMAEVEQAAATARQAGPLADASARQEVVVQETHVAQLEAEREEQRLQATVRKPADARAYEAITIARAERDAKISAAEAHAREVELQSQANAQRVKLEADADAERVRLHAHAEAEHLRLDAAARAEATEKNGQAEAIATRAKGLAEGEAVRARGMAEAEAIDARAKALAENQAAVISQQLAERWPEIVEAAGKAFGAIDQMIVLNGAQGLSEALASVMGQGMAGFNLARQLITSGAETASTGAETASTGAETALPASGELVGTSGGNGSGPAA